MAPPPKKKVKSGLATCWGQSQHPNSSPLASIPRPSLTATPATTSSDIEGENPSQQSDAKTQNRGNASFIWDHGSEILRQDGSRGWKCTYCNHIIPYLSGTSNQGTHLKKKHHITGDKETLNNNQTTLDTHILRPFRVEVARKLLVEYHIERRAPFLAIESPALRRFIAYLEPRAVKALVTAPTLRADCMRYFETAKTTIKQILAHALSRIHLTWDLWTSPNFKAMIAITAHWTDENWKTQSTLMAIRELEGDHDGENISQIVFSVLKEFDVVNKFGYFTGDNASNNDTALEWLTQRLVDDGGIGFNVTERRLRCFAHDMQIAVNGLLFGPKVKELETYEATANATDAEKAEWIKVKWRSFGAIGKLHNIVKYIRVSPKRRAGFKTLLQDLEKKSVRVPVMDNDTRWGSVAMMVEYGLENRDAIDMYCCEQTALVEDMLSKEDWMELQTVPPPKESTNMLRGHEDSYPIQKIDKAWTIQKQRFGVYCRRIVGL
jgi:hypothetical protein